METKVVKFKKSYTMLDKVRTMSKEKFIKKHASGTLRKNTKLGLKTYSQYLEERIAYEFGWEFQTDYATRVTVGPAMSEGDVKGSTELGWHAERYLNTRVFKEDKVAVKYITYEDREGNIREGNGIIIEETSFNLPNGYIVFAIIQEWDNNKNEWLEAVNPF